MLRHTLITNLYTNGVDVKTTQELARHSNINTTLNVYTHLEQKNNFKALSSVFDKNYPKNTPKIQEKRNVIIKKALYIKAFKKLYRMNNLTIM